jgi:hypothetical protein
MDETRGALRLRDAVLALAAAAIAFLLPTLVAGLDGTATLTGAAHGTTHLGTRTSSARFATRRSAPIVLTTRATDPTHHPLRPRAPGTV